MPRSASMGNDLMLFSRLTGSAVVHFIFILVAGYIIWIGHDLPADGGMLPSLAAAGAIVFSAYHIFTELFRNPDASETPVVPPVSVGVIRVVSIFTLTAVYVFVLFQIGYFVTTAVYLVAAALVLGVRGWRAITLTLVVLMPLMYGFFILFLGANLPKGFLI